MSTTRVEAISITHSGQQGSFDDERTGGEGKPTVELHGKFGIARVEANASLGKAGDETEVMVFTTRGCKPHGSFGEAGNGTKVIVFVANGGKQGVH